MNLHALSALLPGKWQVINKESDQTVNEIVRADGLSLQFVAGGYYGNVGKIAIRFYRPVGRDRRAPTLYRNGSGTIVNPSVNVSDKKTDVQIAKAIVRGLLPESEEVFKLANEAIARENAFLDGKVKTVNAIAALCGTQPERHYYTKELTYEIDPFKGAGVAKFQKHGYGKITVSSEDSVNIELTSVGLDTAAQIVSAINCILSNRA